MFKTIQFKAACVFLLAGFLAACGNDDAASPETSVTTAVDTSSAANSPAPQTNPLNTDPMALPPSGEWPTNGGSFYNQRWSPLDQINRDNISQLKAEWRVHLNGSGMETKYSAEGTPLYKDGVLYMTTGDSDVFAVSLESGEIIWDYDSVFPEAMGQQVCCGWDNRGVALGDGKVFVGQLDARLVALDEISWRSKLGNPECALGRWLQYYRCASILRRHGDHRLFGC